MRAVLLLLSVCCGAACGVNAPSSEAGVDKLPTRATEISSFIAKGSYKGWKCEANVHDGRAGSPHGKNRICSNALLAQTPASEVSYPVDAANVKEIYDSSGTRLVAFAAMRKVKYGTGADSWYYYEKNEGETSASIDAVGASVCTGCHGSAGSDAQHPGKDYAFTQVSQ